LLQPPVFPRGASIPACCGWLTPRDSALLGAGHNLPFWFRASCIGPEIKTPRIGFPNAVRAPESPGSPVQTTHFTAAGTLSDRRPWRWQFGSWEMLEAHDLVLLLRTLRFATGKVGLLQILQPDDEGRAHAQFASRHRQLHVPLPPF